VKKTEGTGGTGTHQERTGVLETSAHEEEIIKWLIIMIMVMKRVVK
jgi:hypothetical protein